MAQDTRDPELLALADEMEATIAGRRWGADN